MIAVLLAKNDPTTPIGFPPDYFRDARGPVDKLPKELSDLGYILVTEEEYDQIVESNQDALSQWQKSKEDLQKQTEDQAYAAKVTEIETLTAKAAAVDTMGDRERLDAIPNILKVLGSLEEQLKKLVASR